jgi:hypothetical protein
MRLMLDRTSSLIEGQGSREQDTPFRGKRERQKLVVRTKKGEVLCGFSFGLNRKSSDFHLDLQNKQGESLNRTIRVAFEDIKAVFYVKSFDGRFNPDDFKEWELPETRPVAVKFTDGEILIGRPSHHHWADEARFLIVPEEANSNNLMILIERSAVASVHDAKSYARKQQEEYERFKEEHFKPGMSEEECKGDFHFAMHDYGDALRWYRILQEKEPQNERVVKKMCTAKYNLGIRHIKNRNYTQALRFMELILKIAPNHPQALEKASQLRTHIAKHNKE